MKHRQWVVLLGIVALSACSSNTVKDTLGLNRSAPDEFRVVSRPPLSVPPEFSLRPPATGDASPNQASATQTAKGILGTSGSPSTLPAHGTAPVAATVIAPSRNAVRPASTSESQFLKNAGADKADPQIRNVMAEEKYTRIEQQDNSSWWNPFSSSPEKKDPAVDAQKEADRIKQNTESGQPVTTGDTPEVKSRDTGVLGRIFGY